MFKLTPPERPRRPQSTEQPPCDYDTQPLSLTLFPTPQPPLAIEPKPLPAPREPKPQPTWLPREERAS